MFGFGRRDVADGLQQPAVVEPVDSFKGRVFHRFEGPPGSTAMDHLRLVEPTDRFGQSVVVAIVYAANRRFDSSLREALSVFDGHLLGPTVAMMNEAAPMGRPSIVKRLF